MEARQSVSPGLKELPDIISNLNDVNMPANSLARMESIVSKTVLHTLLGRLEEDYDNQLPVVLKFLQDRWDLLNATKLLSLPYVGSAINKACQLLASALPEVDASILRQYQHLTFITDSQLSEDEEQASTFRFLAKYVSKKTDLGYLSSILKSVDNDLWRLFASEIVYFLESRERFIDFIACQLERGVWEEALGIIHFLPICDLLLSKDFSMLARRFEEDLQNDHRTSKFSQYKDRREIEFRRQVLESAKFHFERLIDSSRYSVIDSRDYDQEKTRAYCFLLAFVYEKIRASEHTYKSNVTWGFSKLTLGLFNDALGVQDKNKKMSACHLFRRYITDSDRHDNLSAFLAGINQSQHLPALTERYTLTDRQTQLSWLVKFYQDEMQRAEQMYPRHSEPAASSSPTAGVNR